MKSPDFDTLFPLYDEEWSYLDSIGYERIWNRGILESGNYHEFTDWHIRELSRLRFLPGEWPVELRELLKDSNGRHLLVSSQLPADIWQNKPWKEIKTDIDYAFANRFESDIDQQPYQSAIKNAEDLLKVEDMEMGDFESWDGTILSTDFYRIRNAGELALRHIPDERFRQYELIAREFKNRELLNWEPGSAGLLRQLHAVFEVMAILLNRLPGEHTMINLDTGNLSEIGD